MFHLVAHSTLDNWLVHDWSEARNLWQRLVLLDGLQAACIMPDHIHIIVKRADKERWLNALRGFARWRNRRRDTIGAQVWLPLPAPRVIPSYKHLFRSLRYVHLNPCRDHLVADPLAWPFSTHRDSVGLAIPAALAPHRDPDFFHRYVSSDPTVHVEGTNLPFSRFSFGAPTMEQVEAAVSAITRTPLSQLERHSPQRTLLLRCLKLFTSLTNNEIAARMGLARRSIQRLAVQAKGGEQRVERVLADPRFPALYDELLPRSSTWAAYRLKRQRSGAYQRLERSLDPRRKRQTAWQQISNGGRK